MPVGKKVSDTGEFTSKYRLIWQVPYQPGTLKAIAYSGGKQVAQQEMPTASAPARIKLLADRNVIHAGGDDLSYITVRLEDKDGNLCPLADNLIHFAVSGAGEIAGVDNGNAATTEPFQADHRRAFSGMALLILRSHSEQGKIHVVATGDGLAQAQIDIQTKSEMAAKK
jgi:beta-galactosidase